MNKLFFIITLTIFSIGCNNTEKEYNIYSIDDIREKFELQAEEQNKKLYEWDKKIEELYNRADQEFEYGIQYADSLLEFDKSLDKWKVSKLHEIAGELYYDNEMINLALERFKLYENISFDSPGNKANKAGCYIKKGDLEKAMELLIEAADFNHEFKWHIGNLFEIQGEREKAIEQYKYLYLRDTIIYAYCNERIIEITEKAHYNMQELIYRNRRRRTLFLLKGVDSSAAPTAFGRFELDVRD
jgi:tetratricopeptide (TPR) repeat protein